MIKKSLRLVFASFVIIGGTAVVNFAQGGEHHKPKSINERQEQQRERIRDGVQDGDIGKRELGRLAREQGQIRRQERVFRSDGDFTRGERARVQRNLNQANRHIRRASRN
jgi:hypothetical protein